MKIGTVLKVVWFSCCALKARSARVISETSEVAFRSSMKRLPQGGIMRDERLRQDDAPERLRRGSC